MFSNQHSSSLDPHVDSPGRLHLTETRQQPAMATPAEQQAAANSFIQEVWGLQGVAYLVVGLRYYSQFTSFGRRLQWDDILMLLATVS